MRSGGWTEKDPDWRVVWKLGMGVVEALRQRARGFEEGRVDLHASKVGEVVIWSVGKSLGGEGCHVVRRRYGWVDAACRMVG